MKKFLALLLAIVMALSVGVFSVSAEATEISDEFLNAVRVDYHNEEIGKDDIQISYMKSLTDEKYLVSFTVSGYGYTCDMVDIELGNYILNTSRPVPNIYANGVIYELENAYEQEFLNDEDLSMMCGFEELNMVKSTITKELQYQMMGYEMDEYINVRFEVVGSQKNITDYYEYGVVSLSEAVVLLNEHYESLHEKLVGEVLADIEYIDLVHNDGISIIGLKRADIEKVADSDFVTNMDYISEIHMKYIDTYKPKLTEYFYEEKCAESDEDGELHYYLIEANIGMSSSAEIGFRFGNHIIKSGSINSHFTYGYGIYDVKEDSFYDVYELKDELDKYHRLEDHLAFYSRARVAGDADCDRNITVLDATCIQRHLANLQWLIYEEDYYVSHESDGTGYVSDIDNDGEITVMDATAIQMLLVENAG